jgi:hypothetical protein
MTIKPTTQKVISRILHELVSDNPSNWGGWSGGVPGGNGSALSGIKKGARDDTGGIPSKKPAVGWRGTFKLDGKKTQVILEPTLQQSANKIDLKDPTPAKADNTANPGKPRYT